MFELVPLGNKNVGKNSNGHRIGDGLDNTFCFDDNYKGDVRSLRRFNVQDATRYHPFPRDISKSSIINFDDSPDP